MFFRNLPVAALVAVAVMQGNAFAQTPPQLDKKSPDFRVGYNDGCEHATTGNTRNETRFLTNASYHNGWIAGFDSCYMHNTIQTNGDPNGPLKNLF